jgi:hypothetical protein
MLRGQRTSGRCDVDDEDDMTFTDLELETYPGTSTGYAPVPPQKARQTLYFPMTLDDAADFGEREATK